MRIIFLSFMSVFVVVFSCSIARSQSDVLTVDLAQDRVDITTGFDGAYLSLFGVKERDGQVAIVIRGPKRDVLVRKKNRVSGVWLNSQSLEFKDVPQFYDFAISDAEENILNEDIRKEKGIGFAALNFTAQKNDLKPKPLKEFQSALRRNKQVEGLFPVVAKDVIFLSDTFFKTEFYVPPNVPTGEYVIETFLINGGNIIDKRETKVMVAQVGFSSGVYRFANLYSLGYALIIVLIAVVAGWLSNAVRQKNK